MNRRKSTTAATVTNGVASENRLVTIGGAFTSKGELGGEEAGGKTS